MLIATLDTFCSIRKTEVCQGADIFRLHRHGPAENVFPTKVGTLDSNTGAKLRSTCQVKKTGITEELLGKVVKCRPKADILYICSL